MVLFSLLFFVSLIVDYIRPSLSLSFPCSGSRCHCTNASFPVQTEVRADFITVCLEFNLFYNDMYIVYKYILEYENSDAVRVPRRVSVHHSIALHLMRL